VFQKQVAALVLEPAPRVRLRDSDEEEEEGKEEKAAEEEQEKEDPKVLIKRIAAEADGGRALLQECVVCLCWLLFWFFFA